MRKVLKRLPSPSMTVAFVALLAALTGTAVALPGSNTVTSGDIKNSQVKTQDIRNSTIRGKDVRNSTIRGADVGANSLTGSDINEATLGTVPSASTANSANSANTANSAGTAGNVAGVTPRRILYRGATGSPAQTILSLNGLVLTATCTGGDLQVVVTTTVDDAAYSAIAQSDDVSNNNDSHGGDVPDTPDSNENDVSAASDDSNFDVGDSDDIVPATAIGAEETDDEGSGSLTYVRQDGGIVTLQWIAQEGAGTTDCLFAGHAFSS
jgi:hypothetical protein